LDGIGRTKEEGGFGFLSSIESDEDKRSGRNSGSAFSPCLKFIQDIYTIE